MKHIRVNTKYYVNEPELEEKLNQYIDDNQQSEGDRTRYFLGWKFRVSANNRILYPWQPENTIIDAEISDDKEDEISDFSIDQDHYNDSY